MKGCSDHKGIELMSTDTKATKRKTPTKTQFFVGDTVSVDCCENELVNLMATQAETLFGELEYIETCLRMLVIEQTNSRSID